MKIFVPGNHDWGFQTHTDEYKQKCEDLDITLLMDSGMQYKKVNFWGSPATPEFNNWAFNYARNPWESTMERPFIGNCWNKIPLNTDILITHGPPYGILDRNMNGMPCGCEILAETIGIVKPTMHLFGHIHEGNGVIVKGDITYVNASCLNASYRLYPVHYRRFDWEKVRNGERYGSY
jgi:Icc-related predicted phosphoesterase